MFGTKQVPAVGVSLGIERVFLIMEQRQKDQNQVIVAHFFRLGLCSYNFFLVPSHRQVNCTQGQLQYMHINRIQR